MLLNKNGHNKNNNNNLPEINLEYSVNNFDGSVNLDQNNKDVDNFFTVVKSQIVDDNNNEKINDDGNIEQNFDFEINMNDFKDDLYSNKKYNINKDEIKKNLKSKINKKSEFMKGNAKLKYDDDIEMELDINNYDNTKKSKFDEIQKRLERENKFKLENIQVNTDVFLFDKNKLTSFANEKYEYLLPQFLEIREDTNELNDPNNNEKIDSYLKIRNESNINNSESKSDIARAERFTTSNKKKISLDNFDSSNLLMNNLSRLTLDKNDFKGAKSFIEKLNIMDKDTKDENNKDEINLNSNINNDMDLINDDNELNDNNNNESILPENKNKEIKSSEELKEEEDANLLKEDLQNNVFKKSKKKVSFEKIREKLENRDKFENPKLFYDLLLLAQKGDVELTQNEIMDNKGINVSLKY